MLPRAADVGNEKIECLRVLYEFTSELLIAQSSEVLSDMLGAFMQRTIKADRCVVLLWNTHRNEMDVASSYGPKKSGGANAKHRRSAYNENVAVLSGCKHGCAFFQWRLDKGLDPFGP